jgi:hypothetical protein
MFSLSSEKWMHERKVLGVTVSLCVWEMHAKLQTLLGAGRVFICCQVMHYMAMRKALLVRANKFRSFHSFVTAIAKRKKKTVVYIFIFLYNKYVETRCSSPGFLFFKKKGVPCPEQTIQTPSYVSRFLKLSLAVWNCYTLGESISNRTSISNRYRARLDPPNLSLAK